jgi:hypothetical protein
MQQRLWNGEDVVHDMGELQRLVLGDIKVSYLVAWNELFGTRDDVFHKVLKKNVRMRFEKIEMKLWKTYHRDGFVSWEIGLHI